MIGKVVVFAMAMVLFVSSGYGQTIKAEQFILTKNGKTYGTWKIGQEDESIFTLNAAKSQKPGIICTVSREGTANIVFLNQKQPQQYPSIEIATGPNGFPYCIFYQNNKRVLVATVLGPSMSTIALCQDEKPVILLSSEPSVSSLSFNNFKNNDQITRVLLFMSNKNEAHGMALFNKSAVLQTVLQYSDKNVSSKLEMLNQKGQTGVFLGYSHAIGTFVLGTTPN